MQGRHWIACIQSRRRITACYCSSNFPQSFPANWMRRTRSSARFLRGQPGQGMASGYGTIPHAGMPGWETNKPKMKTILGATAALATVAALVAGYSSSSSAVSLLGREPVYVVDLPMPVGKSIRPSFQNRGFQG